jgi:hypothetical protein
LIITRLPVGRVAVVAVVAVVASAVVVDILLVFEKRNVSYKKRAARRFQFHPLKKPNKVVYVILFGVCFILQNRVMCCSWVRVY